MSIKNFSTKEILEALLNGENLTNEKATSLMMAWLNEEISPVNTGAILSALRSKGVSGSELSSMAMVLRDACKIPIQKPTLSLVDTCGTGGDGANTFNISTAVAFLAASCGVYVAKHGNRSASGKVGSADVLEGLGLPLNSPQNLIIEAVTKVKVTFLFAPAWHSSLINLAPLRRDLGIRTVFNLLGPLVNPLQPDSQVLGVASANLLDPMAEALKNLGVKRGLVVHGAGGLDEASLEGTNQIRLIDKNEIRRIDLNPKDFGIDLSSNNALTGGDLEENIKILSSILKGKGSSSQSNVVALNNALVLWVSGIQDDFKIGFESSLDKLKSGEAWNSFESLKSFLEKK